MPKAQTRLTAEQTRKLHRLVEKVERAKAATEVANRNLDEFLADPEVSVPAAAREMGLVPQTLYQRLGRRPE